MSFDPSSFRNSLRTLVVLFWMAVSVAQAQKRTPEETRQFVKAVNRVVHFLEWPDRSFQSIEKGEFQIGLERTNPQDFALTSLNNLRESKTRVIRVWAARPDMSHQDLQRFEMIVIQNRDKVQSFRQRTENGAGATLLVGTFPGALEAGCAVAVFPDGKGNYTYRLNLAEMKARDVEVTTEFLRYIKNPLRERVPFPKSE